MSIFWDTTLPLMASKGITQVDIGNHLRKEKSTINHWIKYDRIPPANFAQGIADLLEVELRYLITGIDSEADTILQRVKNDNSLREILTKIIKVDKKYWVKIRQAIDMAIALCVDDEDKKERIG